jgi:hypothetical protein
MDEISVDGLPVWGIAAMSTGDHFLCRPAAGFGGENFSQVINMQVRER